MHQGKPFPKIKGKKRLIDLDALKELYLSGPDYDWTPFCNRNGFSSKDNRNKWKSRGFNFTEWKREWLGRQAQMQDEEIGPEILDLRKFVSLQRVKFVKDWTSRTQYMKTMLDAMLRKHGEDLQHDMQNSLQIRAGKERARFKMLPDELHNLAGAAQRLQEIETRALMLTGDKMNHPQIMAGGAVGYEENGNDAPVMEVATMGSAGMSAAETAKLLAAWFDQSGKSEDEPK